MPEQPHPAEDKLQRYARERRAAAGDFALHPATRRLLQGEVARQFGGDTPTRRGGIASWFTGWRTLAISCGLLAVLGVVTWLLLYRGNEPLLVKVDSPAELGREQKQLTDEPISGVIRSAPSVAPAPQPTAPARANTPAEAPETEALFAKREAIAGSTQNTNVLRTSSAKAADRFDRMDFVSTDAERSVQYAVQGSAAVAKASRSAAKGMAGQSSLAQSNGDTTAQRFQRLEPSPTPPAEQNYALQNSPVQMRGGPGGAQAVTPANANTGTEVPKAAAPDASQNAANQTYFNRAANVGAEESRLQRDLAKTLAEPPVLSRFSIEPFNGGVRITDADGSVYDGAFGELPAAAGPDVARKTKQLSLPQQSDAGRDLTFHASGTNRTLNQLVVVEGRLASPLAPIAAGVFADSATDKKVAERELAIQAVPPAAPVPSTTPLSTAKPAAATASSTNVTAVEGTWRIGTSTRPFRATRVIR